jgi:hypothetical protein
MGYDADAMTMERFLALEAAFQGQKREQKKRKESSEKDQRMCPVMSGRVAGSCFSPERR